MHGNPPGSLRDKSELRTAIRLRTPSMTSEVRAAESERLCARVVGLPEWKNAGSLAGFCSRWDEPDLRWVLEAAWAEAKVLVLPAFEPASGAYLLRRVLGPGDLVPGRFNLLEPAPTCPVVPVESLDLALVPGICFSPEGGRLGRGKGFYDRLLHSLRGISCGVGFDFQIEPFVPMESHDVPMQLVLTPSFLWRPARG